MTELRYFKLSDFDCQETGENEMDEGCISHAMTANRMTACAICHSERAT